jgi:alkylated DNA repair dioxygenase AlkB
VQNLNFTPIAGPNSRRVVQFGYTYSYDRSGLMPTADIPDILRLDNLISLDFLDHFKEVFNTSTTNLNFDPAKFDQLIINEYKPGQQIGPHIDHPSQFGDIICCISIGETSYVRFSYDQEKKSFKYKLEPGSIYIMSGDARYKWKHSLVNRGNHIRYSLTYRIVRKNKSLK